MSGSMPRIACAVLCLFVLGACDIGSIKLPAIVASLTPTSTLTPTATPTQTPTSTHTVTPTPLGGGSRIATINPLWSGQIILINSLGIFAPRKALGIFDPRALLLSEDTTLQHVSSKHK